MQEHSDSENTGVRDEMGSQDLQSEAALQVRDSELSSYLLVEYHPGKLPDAYLNLMLHRWLRSLRFGNDYFKLIAPSAYYPSYEAYLKKLINAATVRLAVLSDDRDVTLGFSVFRNNVLDYIYVLAIHRLSGIATQLMPEDIDTITHLTRTGLTIWANKYPKLIFNPFA